MSPPEDLLKRGSLSIEEMSRALRIDRQQALKRQIAETQAEIDRLEREIAFTRRVAGVALVVFVASLAFSALALIFGW